MIVQHTEGSSAYRVVYVVDGEERVSPAEYLRLREAADEAWKLRRAGLVAWAEAVA